MAYSLTWLPGVLRTAGLKVVTQEGWESRGRGEFGPAYGVMCHHTAGPLQGDMPSLNTLINGRSDLEGPLAQLGLGRDGTYFVIAAGKCNHAGRGEWKDITSGNAHFIGIEAENTGGVTDPFPAVQMDAYHRGVAAILQHIVQGSNWCVGHKEWALPKGRKVDPRFDMDVFRENVSVLLRSETPISEYVGRMDAAVAGLEADISSLKKQLEASKTEIARLKSEKT